jgi:structural maintenance of chromosomes protein 5
VKTLYCVIRIRLTVSTFLVNKTYNSIKDASKRILDISRKKVFGVEPELREEYELIEQKRTEYDKACEQAAAAGAPPPPVDGVELRSAEELEAELQIQEANLEMNLNTNPGVVEQYERRKQEVQCPYYSRVLRQLIWHRSKLSPLR